MASKYDDPKKLLDSCGKFIYHDTDASQLKDIFKNGLSDFWFSPDASLCDDFMIVNHPEYDNIITIEISTKQLKPELCDFTVDLGDGYSDEWGNTGIYNGTITKFHNIYNSNGDEMSDDEINELIDDNNIRFVNEDLNSNKDSQGNTLSNEQIEFFKNSKVRDNNGNLLLCYHGTGANIDYFNQPINWFSVDKEYSMEFANFWGGSNGKLYEVYLNCKNIFDCGNTSEKVCNLFPLMKPHKFTPYFADLMNRLGVSDIQSFVDKVVKERDDEDFVDEDNLDIYEYGLKAHIVTRTKAFKELVASKGYDAIRTIEGGCECFGVFDSKDVKLVSNKKPSSSNQIKEHLKHK